MVTVSRVFIAISAQFFPDNRLLIMGLSFLDMDG